MDLVHSEKKPTRFSVPHVALEHLSVSAIQQAAMLPAGHGWYIFLSMEDVQKLRRIGVYRAAFGSVQGIVFKWASSAAAKQAIIYLSNDLGMSFISAKKAVLLNRGFAILVVWGNASALPEVHTKLNALSTFPTESLLELPRFFQFTFRAEEALHVKEKWTLWNTIVKVSTVLPQWTNAASMRALYRSRHQHA